MSIIELQRQGRTLLLKKAISILDIDSNSHTGMSFGGFTDIMRNRATLNLCNYILNKIKQISNFEDRMKIVYPYNAFPTPIEFTLAYVLNRYPEESFGKDITYEQTKLIEKSNKVIDLIEKVKENSGYKNISKLYSNLLIFKSCLNNAFMSEKLSSDAKETILVFSAYFMDMEKQKIEDMNKPDSDKFKHFIDMINILQNELLMKIKRLGGYNTFLQYKERFMKHIDQLDDYKTTLKHKENELSEMINIQMGDAFWDILRQDLRAKTLKYTNLLSVLQEIGYYLCHVCPEAYDEHERVKGWLDIPLYKQMFEKDAFGLNETIGLSLSLIHAMKERVSFMDLEKYKNYKRIIMEKNISNVEDFVVDLLRNTLEDLIAVKKIADEFKKTTDYAYLKDNFR
jgi:hypothetical protein